MKNAAEEPKEVEDPANTPPAESVKKATAIPGINQTSHSAKTNKITAFWRGVLAHKRLAIPLGVVVVVFLALSLLLLVPQTRYAVLGRVIKRPYTVTLLDSKLRNGISDARVTIGGQSVHTDASSKVTVTVPVGEQTLTISKKYYRSVTQTVFVGVSKDKNSSSVDLSATGRQVAMRVLNTLTGRPLSGASIKILDTSAKTDKNGQATIVLPASADSQQGIITLAGYNTLDTAIRVEPLNKNNLFLGLTPKGRLFFLSNATGTIDVVSTDLNGANRATVLAGTGKEDRAQTVLLASRDWKYLALKSRRDGGDNSKMFLIRTADGKVTTFDEGDASFTPVGWSEAHFIYTVSRSKVAYWQAKQTAIKTYNADTGALSTIAENESNGDEFNYLYSTFGTISILGPEIVYGQGWSARNSGVIQTKQAALIGVKPDGSGKHIIKSFDTPANVYYSVSLATLQYEPHAVYLQISGADKNSYYEYEDGKVSPTDEVDDQKFYGSYNTYLVSPNDQQTFWSEQRDGKNSLFVGDDGHNAVVALKSSDLSAYGWYGEYLLASKKGSELYILPTKYDGSEVINSTTKEPQQLKVSDYYKPEFTARGYGYGYGGL